MDLIKREDAINEMKRFIGYIGIDEDMIDRFKMALNKIPAANSWISVKDILPDKDGDYLVCYTSNVFSPYIDTVGFTTDLALKIRHSEHRPGFYGFNDYSYDDEEENPDYWMPLPELPRE